MTMGKFGGSFLSNTALIPTTGRRETSHKTKEIMNKTKEIMRNDQ